MPRFLIPILAFAGAAIAAGQAGAQDQMDPRRGYATRESLRSSLDWYERAAASTAYSSPLRAQARAEAELILTRLEQGDFQVGDQIVLLVEEEPALSDSFTVEAGPELVLPTIGRVSLKGVLRAELQDSLETAIARFVRDPVVRTRTKIRISILGGVGAPGFYIVSSDGVLTDVLMVAGGPGAAAELDGISIERGDRQIIAEATVEDAIARGLTLDQLGVRAGDRIVVPGDQEGRFGALGALDAPLRALSILLGLPAAIFGLSRLF